MSSVPKLLILGASFLQLPAIEKAKEMGLCVGVVDMDPGAVGVPFADEYFEVSTIDSAGVLAAAQSFGAEGIITVSTDMPMRALAFAASRLHLIGPTEKAAYRATDKLAMYKVLSAAGVPVPRSVAIQRGHEIPPLADWNFPVIAKPVDSSGSRGVIRVDFPKDLDAALRYSRQYSRSGTVLVQEFLEGREISVEGICVGSDINVVAMTDKITTGPPHFVELGHSQPSDFKEKLGTEIELIVRSATRALGLTNCGIHAELMVVGNQPFVIEIGARLGGDFITSHLVRLSTGVDLVANLIQMSLGRRVDVTPKIDFGSAVRFLDNPGNPSELDLVRHLEGIMVAEISPAKSTKVIQSSSDRYGHIVVQARDASSAILLAEQGRSILLRDKNKF